jgi:hypothetical protein
MDVEVPSRATGLSVKQKRRALRQKPERFPFVTDPGNGASWLYCLFNEARASPLA